MSDWLRFWRTTHYNRYGIPTRQVSWTGAVREWQGGPGGAWVAIK